MPSSISEGDSLLKACIYHTVVENIGFLLVEFDQI